METLIQKSIRNIRKKGLLGFFKVFFTYVWYSFKHKSFSYHRKRTPKYLDALFINGCSLLHPSRYRVNHQMEQLRFNNVSCEQVFYEDLDIESVKYYRFFVIFRCPYTDTVGEFIKKAKALNKIVFYDIDDLVIDEKYVKDIEYLQTFNSEEMELYMDGVNRMKKTLLLCDYAITTTQCLADELINYVPEVIVNRNVASEEMLALSQKAIKHKPANLDNVDIGYFSGSITHNDDLLMIAKALSRLMDEYDNIYLHLAGYIDLPTSLLPYKSRIIIHEFVDWRMLPQRIASVDINLLPLQDTLFNRAKSENKWVEAALVKVTTVASNIGELPEIIEDGQTGILCNNSENEWYEAIKRLVVDSSFRDKIADNAYEHAIKHHVTTYTGYKLTKKLLEKLNQSIAFFLPSTNVSGGVNVAIKHSEILQNNGFDVVVFLEIEENSNILYEGIEIPVIPVHQTIINAQIDKGVATLWSTVHTLLQCNSIHEKYYLIQCFETDFFKPGDKDRELANSTYAHQNQLRYITISKWCKQWLLDDFSVHSKYAPNGIDNDLFSPKAKAFQQKIRILIEGNSNVDYKNVDESFLITNDLDKSQFEIWYLSNDGACKYWYGVDKFFNKVDYYNVADIYRQCDILLKTSVLEGFSYPPLEMMATGGIVIAIENEGNREYLVDRENCLFYKKGNYNEARERIYEVIKDESLRNKLIQNGFKEAQQRDWKYIEGEILSLYDLAENHSELNH